jgi:hypothetical protein
MANTVMPLPAMGTLNEGQVWLDTVDTHANEFYRDQRALVDTLITLPAHMILGLALGALAGAARRMAVNPAEPSSPMEYDAMQLLAEAGESCTTLLVQWLHNLLGDANLLEVQMQALGAFQAATFSSEQQVGESGKESMPLDMRLATRVAGALMRSGERDLADSKEPAAAEALVQYAECVPGEAWTRIPEPGSRISRMECIGRVVKREGPYALLELDSVYNVETGVTSEPFEKGKDPEAVAVVREEFVRGLSEVVPKETVRLKLESGLAGHVLTPNEAGEHPDFPAAITDI